MQQLLGKKATPEEAIYDLAERRQKPWVFASAAMTLNGKITSHAKPLGGQADQRWYNLLHEYSDVAVIGAETFRSSAGSGSRYQGREIAILSDSLRLPKDAEIFHQKEIVHIFTSSEKEFSVPNPNVRVLRKEDWTAEEIIESLGQRRIMIDGGGYIYHFFGQVIRDWILCSVPRFVSEERPSIWGGSEESPLLDLRWLYQEDQRLFLRFHNPTALPE